MLIRLVLTSSCIRVTLVIAAPCIAAKSPYYLSFPNIQRTCISPVGVIVWRCELPVFLSLNSLSCDWECKGKKKFLTDKQKMKSFYFSFVSLFKSFRPPVEAGCKGKGLFSTFTRAFEINFSRLCWADMDEQYRYCGHEVPHWSNFCWSSCFGRTRSPLDDLGLQK